MEKEFPIKVTNDGGENLWERGFSNWGSVLIGKEVKISGVGRNKNHKCNNWREVSSGPSV